MLTNRARSLDSRHFLRNRLQRKPTGNPVPPLLPMQSETAALDEERYYSFLGIAAR